MRAHLTLAPLLALAACASTPSVPEEALLPTKTCGPLWIAQCTVNGEARPLLFDTGATHTVFDSRLDLHGTVDLAWGVIEADVEPRTRDLSGLSRALGTRIDGVFGYSTLAGWTVTLDGPARAITAKRGALEGPFEQSALGDGPYLSVNGEAVLLDSGSNGGLELEQFDELAFDAPPVAVSATRTAGGLVLRECGRLAHDLQFGTQALRRPVVTRARGVAVAGMGVLGKFRLAVDAERGRFRLEGADLVDSPPVTGFGLGFRTTSEGLEVVHVMAQGPGETAGLEVGDVIAVLAGRPANARTCRGILRAGEAQRPIQAIVMRAGQPFEASLEVKVLVP